MLGVEAARRLHPESLRRFYAVCALLCGGGCALVGAAPVLGCIFGCMLVQGVIDAYLLHEDQKLNDVIPSDQRATLISVDSMVYSLSLIHIFYALSGLRRPVGSDPACQGLPYQGSCLRSRLRGSTGDVYKRQVIYSTSSVTTWSMRQPFSS